MNQERMTAVIARIEADPDSFDMAEYYAQTSCGTVACLAGHTCLEMGLVPGALYSVSVEEAREDIQGDQQRSWMAQPYQTAHRMIDEYGRRVDVHTTARDYLGLSLKEAQDLFYSFDVRSVEDLRLRVKEVCGEL
jgi:hypothetical protein